LDKETKYSFLGDWVPIAKIRFLERVSIRQIYTLGPSEAKKTHFDDKKVVLSVPFGLDFNINGGKIEKNCIFF